LFKNLALDHHLHIAINNIYSLWFRSNETTSTFYDYIDVIKYFCSKFSILSVYFLRRKKFAAKSPR